jgi:hypothetical protein
MESTVGTTMAGSRFHAPHTAVPGTDFAERFVTAPEDDAGPPRTVELVIGKLVTVSRIATSRWLVGSGSAKIAGVAAVINFLG